MFFLLLLILVTGQGMSMEGEEINPSFSETWALHYAGARMEGFRVPLSLAEDLQFLFDMGFFSSSLSDSRDPSEIEAETEKPSILGYSLGYRPVNELLVDLGWFYFPEQRSGIEVVKKLHPGNMYPGTYLHEAWSRGMGLPSVYQGGLSWSGEADALVARLSMIYSRWSALEPSSSGHAYFYQGEDLRDTMGLALGLKYNVNSVMTLRADYIYDPSPYNMWTGDSEQWTGRHILHFGSGFSRSNFQMDLSYSYLLLFDGDEIDTESSSSGLENRGVLEVNIQYRF